MGFWEWLGAIVIVCLVLDMRHSRATRYVRDLVSRNNRASLLGTCCSSPVQSSYPVEIPKLLLDFCCKLCYNIEPIRRNYGLQRT